MPLSNKTLTNLLLSLLSLAALAHAYLSHLSHFDDDYTLALTIPSLCILLSTALSSLSLLQRPLYFRLYLLFLASTYTLLASDNDYIWELTIGHTMDLFFARRLPDYPGSGWTHWWRYNGDSVLDTLRQIRNLCFYVCAIFSVLVVRFLIPFIVDEFAWPEEKWKPSLSERVEWLTENGSETGKRPPWLPREKVVSVEPKKVEVRKWPQDYEYQRPMTHSRLFGPPLSMVQPKVFLDPRMMHDGVYFS
jgi:hypothetical protein